MDDLEVLKYNLKEKQTPYFSDEELLLLLKMDDGDVRKAS